MLGAVTVKAENAQVNDPNKIVYLPYPLLPITEKLASYRSDTEQWVRRVQKLIRFDKALLEGGREPMAWTAPMTAVAGATFSAAQFNTNIRDNLNETAPAKASAASQVPVSTGANAIAMRTPTTARVDTNETTTSTTYVDLATPGPSVSVTSGTIALVWFAAEIANNTNNSLAKCSVEVSGASSVAVSDLWTLSMDGNAANNYSRGSMMHTFTGLTPGTNTFKMKYAVGSNTGSFKTREINVFPL